ncbi:MAG: amino acid ABC transporter permease [Deinococcus sp.]
MLPDVFTPDVLAALWRGTQLTLGLTAISAVLGLALGFVAALGRMSRLPALRLLAGIYIETFRGTPLLVQLYFLYFAVPQLIRLAIPGFEPLPPFQTGVLGLSLFAGAYAAEIIRGSLNAVPRGQLEAASALGLRPADILARVLVPQAARIAVPALGNQFIGLLKDSSLVSVITVTELLLTARQITSVNYQFAPMYAAVGLIYFLLSNASARVFAALERRLNRPYLTSSARARPPRSPAGG